MAYGTKQGGSTTGPAAVGVDTIAGTDYQAVKLVDGTAGSTTPIPGDANGLKVQPGNSVTASSGGFMVEVVDDAGNSFLKSADDVGDVDIGPTGLLAVAGHVFDGTNFERMQGDAGGLATQGGVAHDAVDSGKPVKIGGQASNGPTPVADGDRVNAWFRPDGSLVTSPVTHGAIADSGADDVATVVHQLTYDGADFGPTTVVPYMFDGTNYDRVRGDTTNGLDVDVTRLPALVAGTANIGDVDVLTVPAPLSTTGGGTEATALRVTVANNSTGLLPVSLASVPSHAVTNAGTFAVQVDGAALTSLQLIDDAIYTDDTSTHATGTSKGALLMAAAAPTDASVDANDIGAVAMTTARALKTDMTTIAGTAAVNGSGTATGALRVELANNGTGVIATVGTITNAVTVNSHAVTNAGTFATQNVSGGLTQGMVDETGASAVDAAAVGGGTPHDAVDSGNPIKIGGYASAAAPSSVSGDGDRVNAWYLRNGAQATVLTAAGALIGGDATNGLDVDVTRSQGAGTGASAQVTVSNSSTTIIAARAARRTVLITNRQTVAVSVDASGGSAVYATHYVLDPGASLTLETAGAVTGITSAAYSASGDAKVHTIELY